MILRLAQLPSTLRGTYGPRKDKLGDRMLFLHPEAAMSLLQLERAAGPFTYTDIFRSAQSSRDSRKARPKAGLKPAGFSGHNFGLAVDIDLAGMTQRGMSHQTILAAFRAHGWVPYRLDDTRGHEEWHFNYLGGAMDAVRSLKRSEWGNVSEIAIRRYYSTEDLCITEPRQRQAALLRLGFYDGEVDGKWGPKSQRAIEKFRDEWDLTHSTPATIGRTLAYVSAETKVTALS